MRELANCPFCGSAPHGVFGPNAELGSFWVECHGPDDNTGCGDWHFIAESSDVYAASEETAIAWNRRAVVLEAVDALERALARAGVGGKHA